MRGRTNISSRSQGWCCFGSGPRLRLLLASLLVLSAITALFQWNPTNSLKEYYWLRINYTFTKDLFINTGFISIPSETTTKYSIAGYKIMRASNVTFLGVARNVAHQLPHVLSEVDRLGGLFGYAQSIFVEGDSDDSTLEVLSRWASQGPDRTILTTSRVNLTDAINVQRNHVMPREGVIGTARNVGLDFMRSRAGKTEFIIVIDMDLLGWSHPGVADSFGRPDWDVICAHGVILHGIYRDTYAFRTDRINTNHHWGDDQNREAPLDTRKQLKRRSHEAKLAVYEAADRSSGASELLPVRSCFGGLTIYRAEAFEGCSYQHRYATPPYMLDCEHVILHECMHDKHDTKFYSNPVMKLWYGAHSLNIKYRDIFGA